MLDKTQKNKLFVLIGTLLLALNPWHIMKSRWALDCNISPDFILIGVCFFVFAFYEISLKKQYTYYISGSLFFVLAAYGYGINWFMLPTLCILLLLLFHKKQKISFVQIGVCICLMLVLLLPLFIYAWLLVSNGESFKIGEFSFIQLDSSRHKLTTVFGSNIPFAMFLSYMKRGLIFMLSGSDNYTSNSFPFFGQIYNILALPIIAIAFFDMFKNKNSTIIDIIFFSWLISVIPILLFFEPNTNHWNSLWFPLIYFNARGLFFIFSKKEVYRNLGFTTICILGIAFMTKYFVHHKKNYELNKGIEQSLEFIKKLDVDSIFVPNLNYTTTLFYIQPNPYEYRKTVILPEKIFENALQYSNLRFIMPNEIKPLHRTAYILPDNEKQKYIINEQNFNIYKVPAYSIYWNK